MVRPRAGSGHGYELRRELFGREREQAELRSRFNDAVSGTGSLVLIAGDAGIGKTSLIRSLVREAATEHVDVLNSACYDLTVTPPYGPWIEIFSRLGEEAAVPLPVDDASLSTYQASSQDALFTEAFDAIASAASRRPLVLILEDMHWSDAASVEFLRYVSRRIQDHPVLIVCTYRDVELSRQHPLRANLPAMIRESEATRINLRPLDDASVAELVSNQYGLTLTDQARLVTYLQQRAEGNPFFIEELLRSLEEKGHISPQGSVWSVGNLTRIPVPDLVQQVIDGRLSRIESEHRQLLAVAAVIGQDIPLDVWKPASGASDDELAEAIQYATDLQILEDAPDSGALRFTHALVREALYLELGLPQRQRLHRIVGETLAARPSAEPDSVAYHLQEANHEQAAEWLMRAGERAHQLYAWRTAAERFEAVLHLLGSTPEVAQVQGWLSYKIGLLLTYADVERSIAYLQTAERLALECQDRHLEAYARADRGLLRCLMGDVRRGLSEMRDGLDALDQLPSLGIPHRSNGSEESLLSVEAIQRGAFDLVGHSLEINTRRGALVFWLAWTGRYAEALDIGELYVQQTPAASGKVQDSLGDALAGLGHAYAALGRPDEALESFARARESFERIDHHFKVGNTAIYELSEAFLPYRADRIMERQWLADQAEAG